MDEYDLDAEDIDKLLEMLGLNHLNSMINIGKIDFLGYKRQINLNLANILNIIKNNLTDDDDDWIITNLILPAIEKSFLEDYGIDISSVWKKINDKVKRIDASKGNGNATVKTGVIRDFSCSVYDALMRVINQINDSSVPVSAWNGYATEEWYSSLFVSLAVQGIHAYFSKLAETNNECKSKIEMIFQNVKSSDYSHSVFIDQNRRLINNVISKVHL
ncbi:MAG: hypothetical protein IJA27_08085 [Lachnospiraceae bacterium]|nr:hypothetical protein [Lachnospiraceae bacterium]